MVRHRHERTHQRMVTTRPARVTMALTVATPPITPAAPATGADKNTAPHRRNLRSGGRPSRTESARLRERILVAATELFLSEGYGPTSIEAVARRSGISKRTFYHRFADKAALFAAVLHRIIEKVRPPSDVPLLEGVTTLHEILRRLAGSVPQGCAVTGCDCPAAPRHRRICPISRADPRRPQRGLGAAGHHDDCGPCSRDRFEDPQFTFQAAEFAAEQFLHTVVALPQRRAIGLGAAIRPEELDAWADNAVRLVSQWLPGLVHRVGESATPQATPIIASLREFSVQL
jgi:AcrR family transcriptional regulator